MAVLVMRHCISKLKQKKSVIYSSQKITFIHVIIHFLVIVAGPGSVLLASLYTRGRLIPIEILTQHV